MHAFPPSLKSALSGRVAAVAIVICTFLTFTVAFADEQSEKAGIDYFETNIRPILFHHCYSCHSAARAKSEGNLVLDSRDGWMKGGDQGSAIVPGDLEASLLIRAVRYRDSDLQMPPVAPLADAEIAKLEQWVKMGAPAPEKMRAPQIVSPSDPVAGKQHWAFLPLHQFNKADQLSSYANPIDHWLQLRQAQDQLQSVPAAQPSVLLRRLHFVLNGIPPTSSQIDQFERAVVNPDAYLETVERLLSSPRFGERWGRHWLDLARYADSNGSDENFLFREAWRYRNWVFEAINQDMPFDQFTTMQLAGDLLPYENTQQRDEQRIATGFLLLGPKVLLGNNPENQKMEIADEQIDTIGRIYFAQTLGCARCHDHKFDPVPTKDYYALAGIFTSTQVMEQRYMLGEQRVMEQLVGLGEDGNELDSTYEKYWRERPKLGENRGKANEALEALKKAEPDEAAFKAIAASHSTAVAPEAVETSRTLQERIAAQQKLVEELNKAWKEPPPIPPRAMISTDRETVKDEKIRIAGQFNKHGEAVPRGFLTVLVDTPSTLPSQTSGRLELAQWLTDHHQSSGQLTARVLANRVWYHLMGRGLVRTVDNFGRTGETPSHPELLDHLAQQLINNNWSIKQLIRHIVTSDAFRRSSEFNAENFRRDPENITYWRYNRRRLDPETFRDSTLSVAGMLDTITYPSTVNYLGDQATAVGENKIRRRTDFPCRSVYLPVIRNDLPELFEILDFTDPQVATGMRRQTIVPTQGLYLLNDEQIMDAAAKVAQQALAIDSQAPELRIAWLFRQIVGQSAAEQDLAALLRSYDKLLQSPSSTQTDPQLGALSIMAHALFASSRFQFIE